MDQSANLYIDLLKRCVSNSIYDDDLDLAKGKSAIDPATGKPVPAPASPERVLAHETGHASTGMQDFGFPNNWQTNENPVMRELGEPPRVRCLRRAF